MSLWKYENCLTAIYHTPTVQQYYHISYYCKYFIYMCVCYMCLCFSNRKVYYPPPSTHSASVIFIYPTSSFLYQSIYFSTYIIKPLHQHAIANPTTSYSSPSFTPHHPQLIHLALPPSLQSSSLIIPIHRRASENLPKNRYLDVLCLDCTRVQLSPRPLGSEQMGDPGDTPTDYINANHMDGYQQRHAYISTQGLRGGGGGLFQIYIYLEDI